MRIPRERRATFCNVITKRTTTRKLFNNYYEKCNLNWIGWESERQSQHILQCYLLLMKRTAIDALMFMYFRMNEWECKTPEKSTIRKSYSKRLLLLSVCRSVFKVKAECYWENGLCVHRLSERKRLRELCDSRSQTKLIRYEFFFRSLCKWIENYPLCWLDVCWLLK